MHSNKLDFFLTFVAQIRSFLISVEISIKNNFLILENAVSQDVAEGGPGGLKVLGQPGLYLATQSFPYPRIKRRAV